MKPINVELTIEVCVEASSFDQQRRALQYLAHNGAHLEMSAFTLDGAFFALQATGKVVRVARVKAAPRKKVK